MRLTNLFKGDMYLNRPMVDGESDYLFPSERGVGVGTQRGDGNQRRSAFNNDLSADVKKTMNDIEAHGAQMYLNKKTGYYRLEFKDKTVLKFSANRWKTSNLSMRSHLLDDALRAIIVRIGNDWQRRYL
jgi:hypothetical protein